MNEAKEWREKPGSVSESTGKVKRIKPATGGAAEGLKGLCTCPCWGLFSYRLVIGPVSITHGVRAETGIPGGHMY